MHAPIADREVLTLRVAHPGGSFAGRRKGRYCLLRVLRRGAGRTAAKRRVARRRHPQHPPGNVLDARWPLHRLVGRSIEPAEPKASLGKSVLFATSCNVLYSFAVRLMQSS